MNKMIIEAIIFDMDGVIVDTELYDFKIQKEFIKKHNPDIDLDKTNFDELIGQSYEMLYKTLQRFINTTVSYQQIGEEFTIFSDWKYENMNYHDVFRKDIVPSLEYAKKNNIKLAVASSSTYKHISEVLNFCGIREYFDVIFSGEHVLQSKPNPDIYLETLKQLNVDASKAISIEDSEYGIAAAKAAGLICIAYKETRVKVNQSQADYTIVDMKELKSLIENLRE